MVIIPKNKLPEFTNPPVGEIGLAVQFAALPAMKNQHVIRYWEQRLKDTFPNVSEHPTVNPVFETFSDTPAIFSLPLPPLFNAQVPRYWFETATGTELVQLQQDQIIHNWRQVKGDEPYPRFNPIRDKFRKEYESFAEFVSANNLGSVQPNQCTVTYINIIKLPDQNDNIFTRLHEVTPLWGGSAAQRLPARLEDATVQMRAVLEDEKGPFARLYVICQPSMHAESKDKAFRMEITARGNPKSTGADDVFGLLQTLHDAIVCSFAEVTTPEMQALWGRTQ